MNLFEISFLKFTLTDLFDLILVTFIFSYAYSYFRGTRGGQMLIGLLIIFFAGFIINILGFKDARPPIEETKLGMLPDLIAPKTFPIPVNRPSFTPNMLEAKTNPAAMPFGFDLSSIKDKASAINCWF